MAEITKKEIEIEEIEEVEEIEVSSPAEETLDVSEIGEEVEKEPKEVSRYCKGTFCWHPVEDFTQNKDYSDPYLKSKGLFLDEDESNAK